MKIITNDQIRSDLSPTLCYCGDARYGIIDYDWLAGDFYFFWQEWLLSLGAVWSAEVWDCEKYALALQDQAHIAAYRADAMVAGALGGLVVPNHALNLACTSKGWMEIEPQAVGVRDFIKPLRSAGRLRCHF